MPTENLETPPINFALLRRARNRSAAKHAQISFFSDEIAKRMLERLEYIKLSPV